MDSLNITAPPLLGNVGSINYPMIACLLTSFVALLLFQFAQRPQSNIPVLNPKATFEITFTRSRGAFIAGARDMIVRWFNGHRDRPARVVADIGMMTILPPSVANEIRNDSRFDFAETMKNVSRIPSVAGHASFTDIQGLPYPSPGFRGHSASP